MGGTSRSSTISPRRRKRMAARVRHVSAPPVGRIAIGREQQRHMIVRRGSAMPKRMGITSRKAGSGRLHAAAPADSRRHGSAVHSGPRAKASPSSSGPSARPSALVRMVLSGDGLACAEQFDLQPCRRPARGGIQHMRRQTAHAGARSPLFHPLRRALSALMLQTLTQQNRSKKGNSVTGSGWPGSR